MPPSTGLQHGPYPRTLIDRYVPQGRTVGVYALGYMSGNTFIVSYVGRSDDHDDGLNGRLHEHDGSKADCTHFKFDYFDSARAAYERECRIFHDFNPPWNSIHPARPAGTKHPCPVDRRCFQGDQS